MPRDFYAEEIEGNVATAPTERDYFAEEIGSIPQVSNKPLTPAKRPDLINAMAGVSPEELVQASLTEQNPLWRNLYKLAAISQFGGKELIAAPAHFANQRLLNLPRAATRAAGFEYPEAQTALGNLAAKSSGIAGALTSPILNKLATLGKGAEIANAPLRYKALAGLATGAAYTPTESNMPIIAPKERLEQGLMGAALGSAVPLAVKGGGKIIEELSKLPSFFRGIVTNIKNIKNPVQFSQNVRKTLFQTKKSVGDAFEAGIQQLSDIDPSKSVDLSDAFKYIKTSIDDVQNNPGLSSEIKGALRKVRNPELAQTIQTLIDDPTKAKNLTLAQSQEIKGIIQQATSISGKAGQGGFAQYKPGDLELLDLVDEIKLAQSEAFPEMAKVREPYAKYMSAYRVVKNKFKPGALLEKMRNGFGDEEIRDMVKVVLPQDTVNQIAGFRRTGKGLNAALKIGGAGVALEGGRRLLKSTIGD